MTYKNYVKALLIFIGIIMITTLTTTILYNQNIINFTVVKILEIIGLLFSSISSGFYIGLKSKNKGYINGLILGGIISFLLLLFSLLISRKIILTNLVAYVIMIIIITISSILGINKRKEH